MSFQADAVQRYAPSMRQKIDLDRLYRVAREQVVPARYDGHDPRPLPEACLFTFDQLLTEHWSALAAVLATQQPDRPG